MTRIYALIFFNILQLFDVTISFDAQIWLVGAPASRHVRPFDTAHLPSSTLHVGKLDVPGSS